LDYLLPCLYYLILYFSLIHVNIQHAIAPTWFEVSCLSMRILTGSFTHVMCKKIFEGVSYAIAHEKLKKKL